VAGDRAIAQENSITHFVSRETIQKGLRQMNYFATRDCAAIVNEGISFSIL